MTDFRDRVALVTGAASGIGHALARQLVEAGAIVYACDRDAQGLNQLAKDLGANLHAVPLDVTERSAVERTLQQAFDRHGRLDLVFNNAGIVVGGAFEDMDEVTWRRIIDINLWGVIHGSESAYRLMRQQGFGHIINTASTAGLMPVAKSAAYSTTKHAVVGLSGSLREEGRAHGIRVSVAIPGLVATRIFSTATNLPGHDYRAAIDRLPIRKISPDQAADAILRGVRKNRPFIVFPTYNRLLWGAYRMAPGLTSRLINRTL